MSDRLQLTAQGLERIFRDPTEKDFAFHVSGRVYFCHPLTADFLSQQISDLHRDDPTVRSFQLATPDPHSVFESLLVLGSGGKVDIPEKDRFVLRSFAMELKNVELYNALQPKKPSTGDVEDWLLNLRECLAIGSDQDQEIVSYLAMNFFEFSVSLVQLLEYSELRLILSDRALVIRSEDWLYGILASLFEVDDRYFDLLECVRFEYLSAESIQHFLDSTNQLYGIMTFRTWERVSRRLSLSIGRTMKGRRWRSSAPTPPAAPPEAVADATGQTHAAPAPAPQRAVPPGQNADAAARPRADRPGPPPPRWPHRTVPPDQFAHARVTLYPGPRVHDGGPGAHWIPAWRQTRPVSDSDSYSDP
jgi:hypothetical protein